MYIEITLFRRWYGVKPLFLKNRIGWVRRGKFHQTGWMYSGLWMGFNISITRDSAANEKKPPKGLKGRPL